MKTIKISFIVLLTILLVGTNAFSINYAYNTTSPSNYGTLVTVPFTTTWWNAENPASAKIRLTNGDKTYNWGNVDGWDGSTTPHYFVIDLGTEKNDIRTVILWNNVDSGSGMSAISTATVYGITASDVTTRWGSLIPLGADPNANTVVFAEGNKWFFQSNNNLTAKRILIDLNPMAPGGWFLFNEIEVNNLPVYTNYAFNTVSPSNYGTLVNQPFTSTWWNAENPASAKIRLTNGDKTYNWGNVDGWDGSTAPHDFIIDLGSVKSDIQSVVIWNNVDAVSSMSAISTAVISGSNDNVSYFPWGSMSPIGNPTTNTVVFGEGNKWSWSGSSQTARFVKIELAPINPGGWFLFCEIEVWGGTVTDVTDWFLYDIKSVNRKF